MNAPFEERFRVLIDGSITMESSMADYVTCCCPLKRMAWETSRHEPYIRRFKTLRTSASGRETVNDLWRDAKLQLEIDGNFRLPTFQETIAFDRQHCFEQFQTPIIVPRCCVLGDVEEPSVGMRRMEGRKVFSWEIMYVRMPCEMDIRWLLIEKTAVEMGYAAPFEEVCDNLSPLSVEAAEQLLRATDFSHT